MLRSPYTPGSIQGLKIERFGSRVLGFRPVDRSESSGCSKCFAIFSAESFLVMLQGLCEKRLCLRIVTLIGGDLAKELKGPEGSWIVGAQGSILQLQRLLKLSAGFRVEPKVPVSLADGVADRCLDLRLL